MGTNQRLQNELRYELNLLRLQNQQLKKNIFQLENRAEELEEVESFVRQICNNDANVLRQMVSLVEQKGQFHSQTLQVLQRQVIQIIWSVVANSNQGLRCSISPQEAEVLLIRLQQVEGVKVNEPLLRGELVKDRSLKTLIKGVQELTSTKLMADREDWIIRVLPDSLLAKKEKK